MSNQVKKLERFITVCDNCGFFVEFKSNFQGPYTKPYGWISVIDDNHSSDNSSCYTFCCPECVIEYHSSGMSSRSDESESINERDRLYPIYYKHFRENIKGNGPAITVAYIFIPEESNIKFNIALCSPLDQFNRRLGRRLASHRFMLGSGRAQCNIGSEEYFDNFVIKNVYSLNKKKAVDAIAACLNYSIYNIKNIHVSKYPNWIKCRRIVNTNGGYRLKKI